MIPGANKYKRKKAPSDGLGDILGDVVDAVSGAAGDAVDAVGGVVRDVAGAAADVAGDVVETASDPAVQRAVSEQKREANVVAKRAATRQRKLVNRYVTTAYSRKLQKKGLPAEQIGKRIAKNKDQLRQDRQRLLSHPKVKEANAQGKVLGPKGIRKVNRESKQTPPSTKDLFATPSWVSPKRNPNNPIIEEPQNDSPLGAIAGVAKDAVEAIRTDPIGGDPGRKAVEGAAQDVVKAVQQNYDPERTGKGPTPEQLRSLSLVPVVGSGAKLAGPAAERVPGILSKALGAAKAERGAGKGIAATTKGVAARGAKAAPKELPTILKQGAKAQGRHTLHSVGGLGVLGAVQRGGTDLPGGATLEGTAKALWEEPWKTAKTTLRAAPAAITGPAALLYTAGQIPFEGTDPFVNTAKAEALGVKQIGENFLSSDPEKVQKSVEDEGALTLFAGAQAARSTPIWTYPRGKVRDAAAGVRRKAGKGRVAPKGVEQKVFGLTERRGQRREIAEIHSRTSNPRRVAEAKHTNAVLHALGRAPKDSHVAYQTLLEYGIRSPEGVKYVRENGPESEPNASGKVNLDAALRYAEQNPGIFKDKHFLQALDAGDKASKHNPAALHGDGEVARWRAHGDLHNVKGPEKMVPRKARPFTKAEDREAAWKDVDSSTTRIAKLRRDADRKLAGAKEAKPTRAKQLKAEANSLRSQAKRETKRVENLKKALDPYTRPDQKSLEGARLAWDEDLKNEYIAEVKAKTDASPLLEPTWTHHATYRSTKSGIETGSFPATAGAREHIRKGTLAEKDLVDRGLEAFIGGTIQAPRRRAAGNDFIREVVETKKLPYTLGGKKHYNVPDSETWDRITGPKTKENPDGGQYSRDHYRRFPLRQFKTALEDPFTDTSHLSGIIQEAEDGRLAGHEPSLIVPRETVLEVASIVSPNRGEIAENAASASQFATKAILATNPAWVVAQVPAEGIPIILAHPELALPTLRKPVPFGRTLELRSEMRRWEKENPEQAAMLQGTAGASPEITAGAANSPRDLDRENSFNPQPAALAAGARQMTRGPIGRAMRSIARLRPLGILDIKRQNAFRQLILQAEADKRFMSAFSGMHHWYRTSAKLSEKFDGKDRVAVYNYLTSTKEGQRELRKLTDHVEGVAGNWTSFTRYEKAYAPLAIFYPFLRYSMRWTFSTFPRDHPLAATVTLMLGQANANELEKILGAPPANFLEYAVPVVRDAENKAEGKQILPGGSRISPGGNTFVGAAGEGTFSSILGAVNPVLGAGMVAVGGPGPFGTVSDGPAGWNAVDQLMSLPAPVRVAGVSSEDIASKLGWVRPQPKSVIAKAYERLDPTKNVRSLLMPWLPLDADKAKMKNELSRALNTMSENSSAKRDDIRFDDSLTVDAREKKIVAMKKRADKAQETTDRILKKLGLGKESEESSERGFAVEDEPKSKDPYATDGYEVENPYSTDGYGGADAKSKKAREYEPPTEAENNLGSIDLPNLSGPLGAIANPLSSLVLGETAQASTRERKAPNPAKRTARQTLDPLGSKTAGAPTRKELVEAGKAGTLKLNRKGKITTPAVRKASRELRKAETRSVPRIEGIENSDQREFAEYLSKYSGIPAKLAGEWAKQEGGGWGSDGVSGGDAGEQNWLGVGYPGERTPMSESHYFNNTTPKKAAKATAEWMEGKIGDEFNYHAAPSIEGIPRLAKEGASEAEIRAYIEGPSAWGTGTIAQTGVSARAGGGKQAVEALKVARRNAKKVGLNPTPFNGDVERGQGKTVTVRADAKGMVNWAKSALGTDEGTPKTMRWGTKYGLNPVTEPWCANFISNGLARRGIQPPSNPNYVPTYEAEWADRNIGTDLSKAKPGDVITYSGEHIALYIGGGRAIGGNQSDSVTEGAVADLSSYPVSMILRPGYRGGKIQIHESTVLPGATTEAALVGGPPTGGEPVEGSTVAATPAQRKKKGKQDETTPAKTGTEKLKLINEIASGNLEGLGIPGYKPSAGPAVADLAALGESLEAQRRKLARL